MDLYQLTYNTLLFLIEQYDIYVQGLNDDPCRGEPVCIKEFLENDFIEILENMGYQLYKNQNYKYVICFEDPI